MNKNKFISFLKIILNPLRLISLFFLYIGYFFGYFADFFDKTSNILVKEVNKTENNLKNIPMSDRTAKIVIVILMICLFIILYNHLHKGII